MHSQYKLTTQFKADNILFCYKILYMLYMAQGNSPDTCPTAAFDDGFWWSRKILTDIASNKNM